tara:strand:- start:846 stop:1118 length:273 start_codon:yes stop_codon:yes gene_type:complete
MGDYFYTDLDGINIEFEYTYELGEKETRDDPGTDTSIDIKHAWAYLPNKVGRPKKVDIMTILDIDCDYDWLQETIIETVNEFHKNPPEDE